MSTVGNVISTAAFYEKFPSASKAFVHLLFGHRQSRFMAVQIIKLLEKDSSVTLSAADKAKITEQFGIYATLLKTRARAETDVLFPCIVSDAPFGAQKDAAIGAFELLKQQYAAADASCAKVSAAIATGNRADIVATLRDLLKSYHAHTIYKEETIIATQLAGIPEAKLIEASKLTGRQYGNTEGVKYVLWGLQELAKVDFGDAPAGKNQELWTESLPWIVRNVVVKLVSISSDTSKYTEAFGAPKGDEDKLFAKFISA